MKKISLITILDNTNFGTYLQTLALAKTIENQGVNVEIVDYTRPFTTFFARIREISNKSFPKILFNVFIRIPFSILLLKKDHQFLAKHIKMSARQYFSFNELKKNPPIADIYMTGSDQVWNSEWNRGLDKAFYLDYAPKNSPKVSYASSIGMDDFPAHEIDTTIELLNKYSHLSVREKSAKTLLKKYGIENVHVVLDPTLLLSKTQWSLYARPQKSKKKEPYLLVYSVETAKENNIIAEMARKIAKERQLKIVGVSYGTKLISKKHLYFCDKVFSGATPDIFLSLMLHANFVVVSSFHGTAFSINFNKEFLSITPNRFNSRVNNILSICNLQSRLVTSTNYDIKQIAPINYEEVNQILSIEKKRSLNYIQELIEIEE